MGGGEQRGMYAEGGCKLDFRFFLYCTAFQHPAQNASTQGHGQPAHLRGYLQRTPYF